MLLRRLAKWDMILAPFDIKFMPQKAVKGQAIADFLATYMCTDNEDDDLLDDEVMLAEIKTWKLYFDGATRTRGAGVGIVFIALAGGLIPYSFYLLEIYSNNVDEYEVLIIGLNWPWKCVLTSLKYSVILS